jgi:hypothetical protein
MDFNNMNRVLLVSAAWQMFQDDGLSEIPKFLWMRVVGQWFARLCRLMMIVRHGLMPE